MKPCTNCKTLIIPALIGYFDKRLPSLWSCIFKNVKFQVFQGIQVLFMKDEGKIGYYKVLSCYMIYIMYILYIKNYFCINLGRHNFLCCSAVSWRIWRYICTEKQLWRPNPIISILFFPGEWNGGSVPAAPLQRYPERAYRLPTTHILRRAKITE